MPTATHSHRRPRVPRRPFFPLAALCLAAALAAPRAAASGFDTGRDAAGAVALADALALTPEQASWLRIRGLGETRTEGDWRGATVDGTRAALGELRRRGFKLCVLLIWDSPVWKSGVRPGPGNRFPIDLREARERARQVAATYGDLVDAWEIYNEPDIGFVADNPEHYAAFFKAVAHGLREGRAAGGGFPECPAPRVVMAALAMPPGPFFQRLAANDFLNHTDALNYHYYGYPEDFADVHRQFQNALAAGVPRRPGRPPLREKHLPVFITEYGYGLLDATARGTVAGRVHQWRFFAGVAPQVTALGVEAPMAFLLPPYLEHELGEFGLTAVPGSGGGLSYTPGDFGLDAAPSWMERPGADGGVTPALAFLLDHAAKNPARPRALATRARPASPFVVDLVAGGDFVQDKQAGAYRVRDAVATTQKAVAVLYNFSNATVTGRLLATLSGGAGSVAIGNDNLPSPGVAGVSVTLSPDERREVSLVLSVPEKVHRPNALELRFVPDGPSSPFVRRHSRKQPFAFRSVAAAPVAGVFSTLLYPSADCMRPRLLFDFAHPPAETVRNALLARPLATGEQKLVPRGRWLVTDGVGVEEIARPGAPALWRFQIDKLPPEPHRPAAAELPLPEDFAVNPDAVLLYAYRLAASAEKNGVRVDTYFRAANGNLFTVQPPVLATAAWQTYRQPAAAFTMGFFGRAAPPWGFFENKPAALVFYFRPRTVPLTVEISAPRLVRLEE